MFQSKITALLLFSLLTEVLFANDFAPRGYSGDKLVENNPFSRVMMPKGNLSQAIGGYANGCQEGAITIPEVGEGYYSIRRGRNRFYTQPVVFELIQHIGRAVAPKRILLGDASQPIGGKMPFGHASHENGLDVDFWFYTIGATEKPSDEFTPLSLADKYNGLMKTELWRPEYRQALYAAATHPQTNRIFVNPIIKQHLCLTETDRSWLWKVRPYGGHDAHFHIRVNCPFDNLFCEPQAPIPMTDGCDADLQKWIDDQAEALRNPKPAKRPSGKKSRPKTIHPECARLLNS